MIVVDDQTAVSLLLLGEVVENSNNVRGRCLSSGHLGKDEAAQSEDPEIRETTFRVRKPAHDKCS